MQIVNHLKMYPQSRINRRKYINNYLTTIAMTEYYNKLVELVKDAGIIGSVRELLEWDELVTMPPGTVERRGLQKAALAAHHHKLATSDKIGELISKAESERLNDEQKAMVREIKFDYEREKKVPEQLVKELQITTTQ